MSAVFYVCGCAVTGVMSLMPQCNHGSFENVIHGLSRKDLISTYPVFFVQEIHLLTLQSQLQLTLSSSNMRHNNKTSRLTSIIVGLFDVYTKRVT